MRILVDTDVLLDVMLERPDFYEDARLIWEKHQEGKISIHVAAITPLNIFYVARKLKDRETALESLKTIVANVNICPVDESILTRAIALGWNDVEDAVQVACALREN